MSKFSSPSLVQLLLSAAGALAAGLTVDVDDAASIKKAAAVVAGDLMSFYTGEIPGLLPGPPPEGDYYQWTGGALWAAMLDYRSRTGDTQYDDKISEGLLWQRGPNNDFLAPNWTASIANDDQAVWGMAALLAAETGFAEPGADDPQWLTLAQNVFNEQSSPDRHVDSGSCEGGLRWQILPFNNGYNYVATTANAAFANLGARLSLQDDHNNTQAESVEDTFNWLQASKFIDGNFNVFDGASTPNCNQINKAQFSLPAALALEAAAAMYNSTDGEAKWKTLVDGLAQQTIDVFFPSGVAKETACEPSHCNTDMTFYKSFLHRSLASTMKLAPYKASLILPVLKTSAAAAAASCTGGDNGRLCDLVWTGHPNGQTGTGQQMSVLSALLSLLPAETAADASNSGSGSGPGSGAGSGANGTNSSGTPTDSSSKPSTTPSSAAQIGTSALILLSSLLLTSLMLS